MLPNPCRCKGDGFVLVEAEEKASRSLARKFPVEDITAHYDLSKHDLGTCDSRSGQ